MNAAGGQGARVEIERRAFLACCASIVSALAGCRSVLDGTRLGHLVVNAPPARAYRPVLSALVRTILPFHHPRFPAVRPEAVEAQLLDLFPIGDEEKYIPLRRTLLIFNEVDLFPALQSPPSRTSAAIDRRLYTEFAGLLPRGVHQFTSLDPAQRASYLHLWGRSAFAIKRKFQRTAKHLIVVSAYSMEAFWRVIGYEGPVLERRS